MLCQQWVKSGAPPPHEHRGMMTAQTITCCVSGMSTSKLGFYVFHADDWNMFSIRCSKTDHWRWIQAANICYKSSIASYFNKCLHFQCIKSTIYRGVNDASTEDGSFLLLLGNQQAHFCFILKFEARTTTSQFIQPPSHGATTEPLLIRWAWTEGSDVRFWLPTSSSCSQLHNNCSSAAGLFSQRLAPQEGETGTCKFWCLRGKKIKFLWNKNQVDVCCF